VSQPEFGPDVLAGVLSARIPDYPRARLVLAMSGGGDSAALAAAAAALAHESAGLELRALHVHHGLTPASDRLAQSALAAARAREIPCTVLKVSVPAPAPGGVEAAARAERYRALGAELKPGEYLVTAHQREDQAETVLLQLLRGSGVAGLSAMPDMAPLGAGWHLRPLLGVSRASLRSYAESQGIEWHEDPMNADSRYDRVYLREVIWPAIVARWPGAAQALARASGHFQSAQRLLDERGSEDLSQIARGAGLDAKLLGELAPDRAANALRSYLAQASLPMPPAARLHSILQSLSARPDRHPSVVWPGAEVHRHEGTLYAFAPLPAWPGGEFALTADSPADLGELGVIALVPGTDAETPRLASEHRAIVVRPRQGGERLRLNPGAPRRAVKDWLRESGLPPWTRERLPFLWCGERLVGILTPYGAWLDVECRADPGNPGHAVRWLGFPRALGITR
jgi:tRNA(Ile)-lysidine synthase